MARPSTYAMMPQPPDFDDNDIEGMEGAYADMRAITGTLLPKPRPSTLNGSWTQSTPGPSSLGAALRQLNSQNGILSHPHQSRYPDTVSEAGSVRSISTTLSISEDDHPLTLDHRPPPHNFPRKDYFSANLLGVDEKYYVYLNANADTQTKETGSRAHLHLIMQIKSYYSKNGAQRIVPTDLLEEGTFVIAKTGAKARGFTEKYFRAEVIGKEGNQVMLINIDEPYGEGKIVPREFVFYPKSFTVKLPPQAAKCEIEDLGIFEGTSIVKQALKQLNIGPDTDLKAFVLWLDPLPKLRLLTKSNENLTELIRRQLPIICEVPLFGFGSEMSVKVTNVTEDGYIWYQLDDNEIMQKILYFAEGFVPTELMEDDPKFKATKRSLEDPDTIFGAPFESSYYRAKIFKIIDDQTVEVSFIDYGNSAVVSVSELFMVEQVDKNLRFIPPQARKVKLHMINNVDVDSVWDHLASTNDQPDVLVVTKQDDGEGEDPEVDILIKGDDDEEPKSLTKILLVIQENEAELHRRKEIQRMALQEAQERREANRLELQRIKDAEEELQNQQLENQRLEAARKRRVQQELELEKEKKEKEACKRKAEEKRLLEEAETLVKKEEERRQIELEARRKKEEEALRKKEEEALRKKQEEALRKKEEEALRKKQEEAVQRVAKEEARLRKAREEERVRKEEEERQREAEEVHLRIEAAARQMLEDQERQRKAEVERLRKEIGEQQKLEDQARQRQAEENRLRQEAEARQRIDKEEQEKVAEKEDQERRIAVQIGVTDQSDGFCNGQQLVNMGNTNSFLVRILGFETASTLTIELLKTEIWEKYSQIMPRLQIFYTSGKGQPIRKEDIGNMKIEYVIAKLKLTGEFIRAKIQGPVDDEGMVECFAIDSYKHVILVSKEDIYYSIPEFDQLPNKIVGCAIEGLDVFFETDFVQKAYTQLSKNGDLILMASAIDSDKVDGLPVLQFMTLSGVNLTDLIIGQISSVCQVPIPQAQVRTPVTIAHVEDGHIWYQMMDNTLLDTLCMLNDIVKYELLVNPGCRNVRKYLDDPNYIFAAQSQNHHNDYYRAKVVQIYNQNMVQVEFIDYGNKDDVSIDSMLLLDHISKALRFIPPQARKVKLFGANFNDTKIVMLAERSEMIYLVVRENPQNEEEIEVDVELMINGEIRSMVEMILDDVVVEKRVYSRNITLHPITQRQQC